MQFLTEDGLPAIVFVGMNSSGNKCAFGSPPVTPLHNTEYCCKKS